jgi:hypothetical protein
LDRQHTSGDPIWEKAIHREEVIRRAMVGPGPAEPRIRSAADLLNASTRTIQRLIARYKSSAQTTSLVPHQPGPRKLYRRLGALRERVINEAIEKRYLVRPKTPVALCIEHAVDGMAPKIYPPSMDGSQLDFSPLPLGCWTQDWHSQGKSVTLKDKKCRNERKTTPYENPHQRAAVATSK